MTLPWRTSPTPLKPSVPRAWPIALPCGSSTPSLGMTKTRAFISLNRRRASNVARGIARRAFGEEAEAARYLLVGFLDSAEIAAEAVLVELLVGLQVPEPAIVRADLVGEDQPHLVVLVVETTKLYFKINEFNTDPEK